MSTDRSAHCCLCGQPRKPTQKPVDRFNNGTEIVNMAKHRPMQPGRWENEPQVLVNVGLWRNGGTATGQTHMCDDCILVGLKHAKVWVDTQIAALSP
jgi:hypothetical protein